MVVKKEINAEWFWEDPPCARTLLERSQRPHVFPPTSLPRGEEGQRFDGACDGELTSSFGDVGPLGALC